MVRFIVDSTFGITREYAKEHCVKSVDLSQYVGDKMFKEGYYDEWDDFYKAFIEAEGKASTSQPNPSDFQNAIDETYAEDPDCDIIILTISERLSGTISSAKIAAMQYPERNIIAIDSMSAALSSHMFLEEMVAYRDAGESYEKLIERASELQLRLSTSFIPRSMTQLERSGRVSKLTATLGNVLKIKPVFVFEHNEVKISHKAIGAGLAINFAVNDIPEDAERIYAYYIYEDTNVEKLLKAFEKRGFKNVETMKISPVLAVHVGVGSVGFSVLRKAK